MPRLFATAREARAAIRRLAFFGQLREGKGVHLFVDALLSLEAGLLGGAEILFLGRETPRWTVDRTRDRLTDVSARGATTRFETRLERSDALAELHRPGTLVVIPSLLENSPYAVVECIERGIPFLAARVGGLPELVAPDDRPRVLFEPTPSALAASLRDVLARRDGVAPVRPAQAPEESLAAWLSLVADIAPPRRKRAAAATRLVVAPSGQEAARRARELAGHTRTVEVEVARPSSRREALERASGDWIVFLDDDDYPDDHALDALVAAQAVSEADVVTAAVRPADDPAALQLFLGDPRALGLVENHYGVFGLVRRRLASAAPPLEGEVDPDWPLLARIALAGGRIVSSPEAMSLHAGRPGTVTDVPGEGLAVLESFEARDPGALRDLPQLAATLAAAYGRHESRPSLDGGSAAGVLRRGFRVLRSEGVGGLARRARKRGRGA